MFARRITYWIVLLLASNIAYSAPVYHITDLTPAGYSSSTAYDINSSGDAVGLASGPSGEAFFYYDHSAGTSTPFGVGVVTPRGAINGTGFRMAAINDDGLVAGSARFLGIGPTETRGFIYNPVGGSFVNLGTLPGATATGIRPASDALDINSLGIATGTATSGAGTIPGEGDNLDVYATSGPPIDDMDGDTTVATRGDRGRAINDLGQVVGGDSSGVAALYVGTSESHFLSGTAIAADVTEAFDINDAGQIVVESYTTSTSYRYDTTSSSLLTIPQIGTGLRMFAKGINEHGDVVGVGDRGTGLSQQGRGFVYDDGDATSYILEDHVFNRSETSGTVGEWNTIDTAWGINDAGWIVGEGGRRLDGGGFTTTRAYLLTPIDVSGLAGDYNNDGTVDMADYTVWRDHLGADEGSLLNDIDGGVIDTDQYNTWRDNVGAMETIGAFGSVNTSAVPEPTSVVLVAIGLLGFWRFRSAAAQRKMKICHNVTIRQLTPSERTPASPAASAPGLLG